MGKDLIFELGSEELPAGFIRPALASLEASVRKRLDEGRLGYASIRTLGTPRRLTVIVEDLEEREPDRTVEVRGPNIKAAYDSDGNPSKALLGFANAQGVSPDELKAVKTGKGEYIYAVKEVKGRETMEVLPDILRSAISSIAFPKAMRWGDHDITYARPLHWILAVYGGSTVCFDYGHLSSGSVTRGHRFVKAHDVLEIQGIVDYLEKLRDHYVIVDHAERAGLIREGIEREAGEVGGRVLSDEELLEEVADLVEYPVVIRGSFDEEFLGLPQEVVINAMREHQRYFSVVDREMRLLPYFVTVANTPVKDTSVVREGNERVLRARLNDARFYYEKDVETPLVEEVEKLKGVVFQVKLGTSYEKVDRFTRLALFTGAELGWCEDLKEGEKVEDFLDDSRNPALLDRSKIPEKDYRKDLIGRAAMLCKADLVTGMVGEFPVLQGIMGREYARRSGECDEVSTAIYEHYLPASAGAEPPSGDVGAIIGIADRLDTIVGCFGVGLVPTGAADPYALRRAALGIIHIILAKGYTLSLDRLVDRAIELLSAKLERDPAEVKRDVLEFIRERLRNQLLSQGLAFDTVDAVLSTPWYDVADTVRRIEALENFKAHPACASLVTAFKRVSNILKGRTIAGAPDEDLFEDEHEKALYRTSREIAPVIREYWRAGDYKKVFETLASIKDAIDAFFDKVMVMVEDERLRDNRLRLLETIRRLYCQIADLSKLAV